MIRRGERGAASPVIILVLAMMLLAVAGMSVDLWRVLVVRRGMLSLADGAALAGATALDEAAFYRDPANPVLDLARATDRVCRHLATHGPDDGFRCGAAGVDLEVGALEVGVELTTEVPLSLLRLLVGGNGPDAITVSVQSRVALVSGSGP